MVQLRPCTGSPKQTWSYEASDGTFRSKLGTASVPLCLAVPKRPAQDKFDVASIVADPLFVDPAAGNFHLHPDSPAISEIGFEAIPPIDAPEALCGATVGVRPCLAFALEDAVTDAPGCQDKAFGECGSGIVPGKTVECCNHMRCAPAKKGAPLVCQP